MEAPESNFKDCASVFVKDDFYESIQAPKFHDFCSSFKEEPDDIEAFFRKSGGLTKTIKQFEGTSLEPNAIKVQKVIIFPKSADFQGCQSASPALIPDDYSTVDGASVCGSKKVRPAVSSNTVRNGPDRGPLKSKTLKRAIVPCNATMPATISERTASDGSQQPPEAESQQPSENEDPNSITRAHRKRAARVSSKAKTTASTSCSIYAQSQSMFEQKEKSVRMVLDVESLPTRVPTRSHDGVEIKYSAVKEKVVVNASQLETSDGKGRKRKPSGRSVGGLVSKALELQPSIKSRVTKVSGKVFVGIDRCSEPREVATSSSRPVRQSKGIVSHSFCAGSMPAPELTRKSSASQKVHRNSDRGHRRRLSRRRLSIAANIRPRRQNLPLHLSTEPEESTRRGFLGEDSSCPKEASSSDQKTRDEGQDEDGMLQPPHSSTGDVSPSFKLFLKSSTEASQERRESFNQVDCNVKDEDQALPEQQQKTLIQQPDSWPDETQTIQGEQRSVNEWLSEQLQNLHLKQGNESVSEKCDEAHKSRGGLDDGRCQLAGSRAYISVRLEVLDPDQEETVQDDQKESKLKGLENLRNLEHEVTVLDICETDSSRLNMGNVEQEKKFAVSEKCQVEARSIIALENTQSSDVFSTTDGCTATSAGAKVDDGDQAPLVELLQTLRLPQGDEPRTSQTLKEETIPFHNQFKGNTHSCSNNEASVMKQEAFVLSACASHRGNESKINIAQECSPESAAPVKKSKGCRIIAGDEQNKERNNVHPATHNPMIARNLYEQQSARPANLQKPWGYAHDPHIFQAKVALQCSTISSSHPPVPSTARIAPLSAVGQQKRMKTTCPQPFRLRTQERGALKEVEFNKKAEQYLAAKGNTQFAPLPCGINKEMKTPQQAPSKELKWHTRRVQKSKTQAAATCGASPHKQEIEKACKDMVLHSQKMPSFNRPFKPHRSTKALTIPNAPNFQHQVKQTAGTTLPATQG